MIKISYIIICIVTLSFVFIEADSHTESLIKNDKQENTNTHSLLVGLSYDVGYGLSSSLTYSIGYVKKQEQKETSIFIIGNYTERIKFGYLIYEKLFHKESSPFFWGYQFGCGYVEWKYHTISFSGGGEERIFESWLPLIGTKFGIRFKIFKNTYSRISTSIISIRYPINIITISIK